MSHESEQYLTNPKSRLLYQSWGSNALTPPFWQFSCPPTSCPVTLYVGWLLGLPGIKFLGWTVLGHMSLFAAFKAVSFISMFLLVLHSFCF